MVITPRSSSPGEGPREARGAPRAGLARSSLEIPVHARGPAPASGHTHVIEKSWCCSGALLPSPSGKSDPRGLADDSTDADAVDPRHLDPLARHHAPGTH